MDKPVQTLGAATVTAVGFVATVTAPSGPVALLAFATLWAGAACLASVIAERLLP